MEEKRLGARGLLLVGLTLFPAAGLPIWQQLFPGQALEIDHIRTHALALVGRGLELAE